MGEAYGDHGAKVVKVVEQVQKATRVNSELNMCSNEDLIDPLSLNKSRDELDNPQIRFKLDGKRLNRLVKKYPDLKIVNLSLLLGEIQMTQVRTEIQIDDDAVPNTLLTEEGKIVPEKFDGKNIVSTNEGYVIEGSGELFPGISQQEWEQYQKLHFGKVASLDRPKLKISTGGE